MINESECCHIVIHREFKKPLVMTKKILKDFKDPIKCCICQNQYKEEVNVKVKDHFQITGKYRGSTH